MLPVNPLADSIAAHKKSLRSQMRLQMKKMAELTPDYRESRIFAGSNAARILRESALYQNADLVLSYVSLDTEFDTGAINALVLADGKQLALPRITGAADMDFFLINPAVPLENQLVKNRYGISEPNQDCPLVSARRLVNTLRKPALMLAPGLAFTRDGKRLGRGKGYYDRYLSRFSAADVICVGVCFECQLLETVPVEMHDRRVEWVLTESRNR
jgi:5-formyltetrahydrofolate cyclo-ligase